MSEKFKISNTATLFDTTTGEVILTGETLLNNKLKFDNSHKKYKVEGTTEDGTTITFYTDKWEEVGDKIYTDYAVITK